MIFVVDKSEPVDNVSCRLEILGVPQPLPCEHHQFFINRVYANFFLNLWISQDIDP